MSFTPDTAVSCSIVVIEVVGGAALTECLRAVRQFDAECLAIVRTSSLAIAQSVVGVQLSLCDEAVPLRRRRAIEFATGELVVLIEDTTLPNINFMEGLRAVFSDAHSAAASGPIVISPDLAARYLALACTEYGRYQRSIVFGGTELGNTDLDNANIDDFNHLSSLALVERLPGNMLCYRRSLVIDIIAESVDGVIEAALNHQLVEQGGQLVMDDRLSSTYCVEDVWGARLTTRFHHGRLYASAAAKKKSYFGRAIQFMKSLLLPVVLSLRAIGYWRALPQRRMSLSVIGWICLLELWWSAGEAVGSVFGATDSMEHWR